MHVPEDPLSMQSSVYFCYLCAMVSHMPIIGRSVSYHSQAIDETVRTRLPGHFNLWM